MIILASKSPRRKELLSNLFGDINIQISNADESYTKVQPSSIVKQISQKKLANIKCGVDDIVISADTIVYFKGEILGKPKDDNDARRMLKLLSNNTHSVYTGVSIKKDNKITTFYDKSTVSFKKLTDSEIDSYISSGSPMDKAGAYGIQDKWLIKNYKGSYTNILGLPMEKLTQQLSELNVEVKWQN